MDDLAALADPSMAPSAELPPHGCLSRGLMIAALLGLLVCFLGLGLVAAGVFTDPGGASDRIPVVAKLGFTLSILGFTAFVDGMLASATVRMPGLVGKGLAFVLLWLPLGLPVTVAAPIGLVSLWFWVP